MYIFQNDISGFFPAHFRTVTGQKWVKWKNNPGFQFSDPKYPILIPYTCILSKKWSFRFFSGSFPDGNRLLVDWYQSDSTPKHTLFCYGWLVCNIIKNGAYRSMFGRNPAKKTCFSGKNPDFFWQNPDSTNFTPRYTQKTLKSQISCL